MQGQYSKHAQINGGTDSKTLPASKVKGQCAGNTPNTLILANRPRTDTGPNQRRIILLQCVLWFHVKWRIIERFGNCVSVA